MAEIPLFPLPLVLFPGGQLQLQIFEVRYLDMVKQCMRDTTGFGVILIEEGEQVLQDGDQQLPSVCHCGTYCTIVDFDQHPNGLLGITIEGQAKFVVRDQYENDARLMMADVEFLDAELDTSIPAQHEHLVNLLGTLLKHENYRGKDLAIDFAQAREVGARLAEILPCPNELKQRLLEMKDPVARLSELEKVIARLQQSPSE